MQTNRISGYRTFRILSLFIVWDILWVLCAVVAFLLYKDGTRYPVEMVGLERMRNAWIGIGIVAAVAVLGAIVLFFVWRAFWRNQAVYDQTLSESQRAAPHSTADISLPISLQGDNLCIRRGFSVQTIPTSSLYWLHHYETTGRGGPSVVLQLHTTVGKKYVRTFSYGNRRGIYTVLDELHKQRPNLLVSEGFYSQQYKECKRIYKNRLT